MDTKQMSRTPVATRRSADFTEQLIEPFTQLRSEVDRLFEGFPFRLPSIRFGRLASIPALEMSETEKSYKISAELPGLDPDDVEVTLDEGILRIAGEKKEEREENEHGYRLSERSYGAFERAISLPSDANPERIDAKFKNGILSITISKDGAQRRNIRKIKVGRDA